MSDPTDDPRVLLDAEWSALRNGLSKAYVASDIDNAGSAEPAAWAIDGNGHPVVVVASSNTISGVRKIRNGLSKAYVASDIDNALITARPRIEALVERIALAAHPPEAGLREALDTVWQDGHRKGVGCGHDRAVCNHGDVAEEVDDALYWNPDFAALRAALASPADPDAAP